MNNAQIFAQTGIKHTAKAWGVFAAAKAEFSKSSPHLSEAERTAAAWEVVRALQA